MYFGSDDDDDFDDDDDDDDEDDDDSDEDDGGDNEDLLRTLMVPPFLNSEPEVRLNSRHCQLTAVTCLVDKSFE